LRRFTLARAFGSNFVHNVNQPLIRNLRNIHLGRRFLLSEADKFVKRLLPFFWRDCSQACELIFD